MDRPRPLWGFGPVGWVLLAVAAALAVPWAAGVDLRFKLLSAICAVFGGDAPFWFVTRCLTWHSMRTVGGPVGGPFGLGPFGVEAHFGLIPLCFVLVALHVHPKRRRWWVYAALIGWALLAPVSRMIVSSMGAWLLGKAEWSAVSWMVQSTLVVGLEDMLTAALLLVVTRWWVVGLFIVAFAGWHIVMDHDIDALGSGGPMWGPRFLLHSRLLIVLPWVYHAGLLALLLWWSIRARLRIVPPGHCPCGYDLAGVVAAECPECGRPRPA